MPFVPGQKDPLFEAVKSVVTGDTQEGQYARNVLGYEPMQESVRVMEISPERREMAAESLMGRTGEMGAPGFRYGQRVYYDGQPYRIESFHEADRFYPDLRLTLVDDEFTRRISGVDAIEVTVPTETTAMGEDIELLDEEDRAKMMSGVTKSMLDNMMRQAMKTEMAVGVAEKDAQNLLRLAERAQRSGWGKDMLDRTSEVFSKVHDARGRLSLLKSRLKLDARYLKK